MVIIGHYIYKSVWSPLIYEILQVHNVLDHVGRIEDTNEHNEYAVDTHRARAISQANRSGQSPTF